MRNIQQTGNLYGEMITLCQISKATAKKMFAAGETIYFQSSNMLPFGIWQSAFPVQLDKEELKSDIEMNNFSIKLYSEQVEKFTHSQDEWSKPLIAEYQDKLNSHTNKAINAFTQFEERLNNFSYYNCDSERGLYVSFYAKK